jgi:DNA-binding response OmpR family regulator
MSALLKWWTAMTTQQAARLDQLISQLAEKLMTAAICADEIRSAIRNEIERTTGDDAVEHGGTTTAQRPLLDPSSFSVIWHGKRLELGHTRPFWLLHRLARCPNQYVTHLDLLHDVWDDEDLRTATIRSVVRHLRRQLCEGGMGDLADAIQGHRGHYVLRV